MIATYQAPMGGEALYGWTLSPSERFPPLSSFDLGRRIMASTVRLRRSSRVCGQFLPFLNRLSFDVTKNADCSKSLSKLVSSTEKSNVRCEVKS